MYASWCDQQYKLTWKDAIETKKHITRSVSRTLFNNFLSFFENLAASYWLIFKKILAFELLYKAREFGCNRLLSNYERLQFSTLYIISDMQ